MLRLIFNYQLTTVIFNKKIGFYKNFKLKIRYEGLNHTDHKIHFQMEPTLLSGRNLVSKSP